MSAGSQLSAQRRFPPHPRSTHDVTLSLSLSLFLSLSLPSTQQRNRVILRDAVLLGAAAAAAAAVAAGILAASTGRKRAPGSIPRERGRKRGEMSRSPASSLLAFSFCDARSSASDGHYPIIDLEFTIAQRGALAGRHTLCMVIAVSSNAR